MVADMLEQGPHHDILDPDGLCFDSPTLDWLAGKTFSAAGQVRIAQRESDLPARIDYVCELLRQKAIVHVGCCDHLPLVADKIARGQWMHERLTSAASDCLGIDLDPVAVATITERFGYTNLVTCDLTQIVPKELQRRTWDALVLGEILEHVDDPVRFLTALRQTCGSHVARMVLTVPNGFSALSQKYAKRGIERINTDHRYWFTPFTLAKVLTRAGYQVESFRFVTYFPIKRTQVIKSVRLRLFPAQRDCLVMIARL